MRRLILGGLTMLAASCSGPAPTVAPLPWFAGFATTAANETPSSGVTDRMARWQMCDSPCAYGGIELIGDVAPPDGNETVLASYGQGVIVLDRDGRMLGRGPGFDPAGSADELVAVALGDAQIGTPVIAIVARVGGHRESDVWLQLFRFGRGEKLDLLFTAIVEEHANGTDWPGTVTFAPGTLAYRAPRATTTDLWVFDARAGRYVYRGVLERRPEEPSNRAHVRPTAHALNRRQMSPRNELPTGIRASPDAPANRAGARAA